MPRSRRCGTARPAAGIVRLGHPRAGTLLRGQGPSGTLTRIPRATPQGTACARLVRRGSCLSVLPTEPRRPRCQKHPSRGREPMPALGKDPHRSEGAPRECDESSPAMSERRRCWTKRRRRPRQGGRTGWSPIKLAPRCRRRRAGTCVSSSRRIETCAGLSIGRRSGLPEWRERNARESATRSPISWVRRGVLVMGRPPGRGRQALGTR